MSQIMDARQARKDLIIQKMSRVRAAVAKLSDEDAVEFADLFEQWSGDGKELKVGDRVAFAGKLWKVLQAHTSQWEWTPTTAPSLFAEVLNPDDPDVIVEWTQPESTNGYPKGQLVLHNGEVWKSDVDNNVWEPGTTGAPWTKQEPAA